MISPNDIIIQFDNFARPILEQRSLLNKNNQKLKEARDLLLPRLMNGSIAVYKMDKLTQYQQIIQQLLRYAAISNSDSKIETQLIFDIERNHYQLVDVGWKNQRRVYGCSLHIDIKDGK